MSAAKNCSHRCWSCSLIARSAAMSAIATQRGDLDRSSAQFGSPGCSARIFWQLPFLACHVVRIWMKVCT